MKLLLFLLAFATVSELHATTDRGLSATDAQPNEEVVAFYWLLFPEDSRGNERYRCIQTCYDDARDCFNRYTIRDCKKNCKERYPVAIENKKSVGLKVASIAQSNPFELLKNFNESPSPAKKPLMLADDYDDCMTECECAGGTYKRCHRSCRD